MSKHEELIKSLRGAGCNIPIADLAADALEAQAREIEGLQAARRAYASEFAPDGEGEPDVGSIHQNIRAMKAENEGLRKDAERWRWAITPSDAQAAFAERLYRSSDSKEGWDFEADAAMGAPHG